MKTLNLFFIGIFFSVVLNAQQLEVINSGGGYLENNEGSITFSIGEVIIETLTHGELCFTQGFCQANVTVTAVSELPDLGFELQAYPNPTKNFVILKINTSTSLSIRNMKYLLYDMNGRILSTKDIVSNETNIPFHFLIPSTYYLKIIDHQTEIKTFKIIKSK